MTIIERVAQVFEDEKRTRPKTIVSWELSGTELPNEKNVPVRLSLSGCAPLYMLCSHQGGDVFLAFPISIRTFLRLKWHRLWRFLGRTH